ncbi:LuxR C-terminal-related transcriptional regulator [Prolixibacteraceae bacterium Z1-6]|uniref:LuxR C-terminal-related transcriptional regulator n=1 Tax=Draconibacterium aestuarii TaxID=2998507 RepID=A0A9X3J675_9BACT|nr:LuxR C-terminal-related transcriptional regulator [Prolixibacteraceae bacterium Z1-6]
MYEIYFNHSNKNLMVENHPKSSTSTLNEMGHSFLVEADLNIKNQYPETWEELAGMHGEGSEMAYARVRNFFVCNFSVKDGRPDIDEDWNFDLENVPCPARLTGRCKDGICNPKMVSALSDREIEVLKLFAQGFDENEIGETLFISKNTVHNHINNMYKKLGIAGKSVPALKLAAYAHRKKII